MTKVVNQVNSEGQALQNGLDVFMSIPVYSGDYLAYSDSFLLQTISSSEDFATTFDGFAAQAIAESPPLVGNSWYRFHTSGVIYESVTSPSTSTNMLTMLAATGDLPPSHSGMYQKLSGLVVGMEYEVRIKFHAQNVNGSLGFTTFYYANQNFTNALQTSTKSFSLGSLNNIEFTFIANSTNDIVLFDFSTTDASSACSISSINILKKDSINIDVISDLGTNGFCKILRNKGTGGEVIETGDDNLPI